MPCLPPAQTPLPSEGLASSVRVSPRTIHFQELDKSPLSRALQGALPSCNARSELELQGRLGEQVSGCWSWDLSLRPPHTKQASLLEWKTEHK